MIAGLMVVTSQPVEGMEDEYNDWYTNVHIPELLRVPGVESAQRFVADESPEGDPSSRRYLAIYELSDDGAKVQEAIRSARASGASTPPVEALDRSSIVVQLYRSITDRVEA